MHNIVLAILVLIKLSLHSGCVVITFEDLDKANLTYRSINQLVPDHSSVFKISKNFI